MRRLVAVLFASLLVVAACSTDPDEEGAGEETTTTTGSDDPTETSVPEPDDPRAPGVTADMIKVGVTYPDLSGLKELIGIDHGDYQRAYQAVADGLNEAGAFGHRQVELVFAPVDPRASDAAAAACTRLAQDEQVFVAVGFFLGHEVNCFVDVNEVQVIGGEMNNERLERAKATWLSIGQSSDGEAQAVETLIEEGVLEDGVAVIGSESDNALYESQMAPLLEEAGIDIVGPAYVDTTSGDANVVNGAVDNILDRFEAEGVEQILSIGVGTAIYLGPRVAAREYSPQLVFTNLNALTGYVAAEGADPSAAVGSVVAAPFNAQAAYDTVENEQTTQCLEYLEAGGHEVVPSDEVPEGEPDNIVSGLAACQNLFLLAEVVQAAGEDLNYGTYRAAAYGLGEVELPGLPEPATYGPPPSADGDLPQFLYDFDPSTSTFVRRDA